MNPNNPQVPPENNTFSTQPVETPVAQPTPPVMSSAAPNGSRKKLAIIIAIVAVLIIGGVILAIALMPRGGDTPVKDAVSTLTGGKSSEVVDRNDGTLDVSQKVVMDKSMKAQDVNAKLGQQVNMNNGTSFMVSKISKIDSFQRTFGGKVKTEQPAASGNEFVEVTFVIGNRLEADDLSYSSSTFDLTDAAGKEYRSESFLSSDPLTPKGYYSLDLEDLKAGEQQSFVLYYEVPKDSSLNVVYSKSYKNYETSETVKLDAKITVR